MSPETRPTASEPVLRRPNRGGVRSVLILLLCAMTLCAAGIAWLLYETPAPQVATETDVPVASTEATPVAPSKPMADPLSSEIGALNRQFEKQAERVRELEAELEAARASGDEETGALRDRLARLVADQGQSREELQVTQAELEEARRSRAQKIEEVETLVATREAEARGRQEEERRRRELEEQARRAEEIERSAVGFGHAHPKKQPTTGGRFNTSMLLRLPTLAPGDSYWAIVGRTSDQQLEIASVQQLTIEEGVADYPVFPRKGRRDYRDKLQDDTWNFFLLTPYGYEKIGRPREGDSVSIHYDFLISLAHVPLTHEDPR